jgi:hypothetical protein
VRKKDRWLETSRYAIYHRRKRKKAGVVLMAVISALGRLRQEDPKFEGKLGYTVRRFLNKQISKQQQNNKRKRRKVLWCSSKHWCEGDKG